MDNRAFRSAASVTLMLYPEFIESNHRIAAAGLHALARRYERGADRTDRAVLADLMALAEATRRRPRSAANSGSRPPPAAG